MRTGSEIAPTGSTRAGALRASTTARDNRAIVAATAERRTSPEVRCVRTRTRHLALAAFALGLVGCGDDAPSPARPTHLDGGVDAGPDAGSPYAGPAAQPCPAGELAVERPSGVACVGAGVPEDACGTGFVPDGFGGCDPILPAAPCGAGMLAIPGETTCREVAPCSAGRWGAAPIDATTQFVDAAYTAGDGDGSEAKPWPTIQQGVDAAAPGGLVAIAAGSYASDVLLDSPVRLWGKCPGEVEVVGQAALYGAIDVRAAAVEVHDLAVTGAGVAVAVDGVLDVLFDRVWIHDNDHLGLMAQDFPDPTSVTLRRSLLDTTHGMAVFGWGSSITIEESVLRDTTANSMQLYGRGVSVADDPDSGRRGTLSIARSVVERNRQVGVTVYGTDVHLEDTFVSDTRPLLADGTEGCGVNVTVDDATGQRSKADLRGVVIAGNRACGLVVRGSDADVETTTVRGTVGQESDGASGTGIVVAGSADAAHHPIVTVRASSIRGNHFAGILASGADLTLESAWIRDTDPQADGSFGRGLDVEVDPLTGDAASLVARGAVVETSHEVGVALLGASAVLESTLVRDTLPRATDDDYGLGLVAQVHLATLQRPEVVMRASRIEGSHGSGVFAGGADVTLEDVEVEGTVPNVGDGAFGDGIAVGVVGIDPPVLAKLVATRCRVANNARAGIAAFGATLELGQSLVECNTISIDGEVFAGERFELVDRGGNVCRCDDVPTECAVLTSSLAPPRAPEP